MKTILLDLAGELRDDVASGRTVPALAAGVTTGLGLLVAHIAYAAFIFSGPLSAYSSQGVGLVLFGCFAACLIVALAGGYRGAIAGLSPALIVGMAAIGSTMVISGEALFVSASVALILSAVLTGICCLTIGHFRLTNLVRFIPYPVAAGFVAGIGGAVCLAAMSLMGAELNRETIPVLLEPATAARWVPGAAFGAALYWAIKRWRSPLILPVGVLLAVGAYHLALAALGISGGEARAAGLLLTSTTDGNLWPALRAADLAHVEWGAIAMQIPNMLTLILIAFIAVVMNIAGLEVAANRELDWDREFTANGIATLVAGLGGGTVSTLVVPASMRSQLLGAATRLTGLVAALVVAAGLFLGDGILEVTPSPLVGGILVFAGLGMLDEGMVKSYRRLPRPEFGIIALIFVAIVAFGLLEGVAAGMLATLIFFAVRLSHVDPIESRFTARERRSNKSRPIPHRAILREEGERVQGYRLRGYIFFGSIGALADRLRKSLRGPVRPDCLLLDFAAVSGLDFSALNVLSRLLETAEASGVKVILSASPQRLIRDFERNLPSAVFAKLLIERDADRALERCEDIVISAWTANENLAEQRRGVLLEQTAEGIELHLERQILFEELIEELSGWLEFREYAAGEILAGTETPSGGLLLLVTGRASAFNAAGERLYQRGPGDSVRPVGVQEQEATSVVAEEPCRAMVVTPADRSWLEEHRPELALKLYRYLFANQFAVRVTPDFDGLGP